MDFETGFTDIVSGLGREEDFVYVLFQTHAAGYRIEANRPDLEEQLAIARKSLKRKKTVRVEARGIDIISITLL